MPNKGNGFRIVVEAINNVLMPKEIFAFQRSLIDERLDVYDENYSFFCGPWDLVTWPVDAPAVGAFPAYYRKSVCDVVLPSESLADKFWENLKAERDNLLAALNAMDKLELMAYYPEAVPNDDSDDSDESGGSDG